jgi:hypothetical protein
MKMRTIFHLSAQRGRKYWKQQILFKPLRLACLRPSGDSGYCAFMQLRTKSTATLKTATGALPRIADGASAYLSEPFAYQRAATDLPLG